MNKILFMLILCLSIFSFTNEDILEKKVAVPEFENLYWEMTKDEVISILGKPAGSQKNTLSYNNVNFFDLKANIQLQFDNGGLSKVEGTAKTEKVRNLELARAFLNKYPMGDLIGDHKTETYSFINSQRETDMGIFFYNKKNPPTILFKFFSPREHDKKINKK